MKKVTCVGGPVDGKVFPVNEATKIFTLNYVDPEPVQVVNEYWDLLKGIIGWDDYGPIYDHSYIMKKAEYRIQGDIAVFQPPQETP